MLQILNISVTIIKHDSLICDFLFIKRFSKVYIGNKKQIVEKSNLSTTFILHFAIKVYFLSCLKTNILPSFSMPITKVSPKLYGDSFLQHIKSQFIRKHSRFLLVLEFNHLYFIYEVRGDYEYEMI